MKRTSLTIPVSLLSLILLAILVLSKSQSRLSRTVEAGAGGVVEEEEERELATEAAEVAAEELREEWESQDKKEQEEERQQQQTTTQKANVISLVKPPRLPPRSLDPRNLVIAGLGDVLLLSSLVAESIGGPDRNFSHLWQPVEFLWREHAHHALFNFEGTVGFVDLRGKIAPAWLDVGADDKNFFSTSITREGFNYHPNLVRDLAQSGIDIATTANNHAFDRGLEGIAETTRILKKYGIVQVGSIPEPGARAQAARLARGKRRLPRGDDGLDPEDGWYKVTNKNGWKVAWIGCTSILCSTCRTSLRAPEATVRQRILYCDQVVKIISYLTKEKKSEIDAIIVGAHWGAQFVDTHAKRIEDMAHEMLEAGATAILGNHPHVMQDAEHYTTKDGRKAYVAYSIGSLTSGLGSSPYYFKRRTSAVFFVELEKLPNGFSQVASVSYVPICEVLNGTRKMYPTALVDPKCAREEKWAIQLLGKDDFAQPNELPKISINVRMR